MLRAEIEDAVDGIQTKSIDVEIFQPAQRVLEEESSDLVAAFPVVIDGLSPRSPVAIGEIRTIRAEIVPLRPKVVVDDIERYRKAMGVSGIHKSLQTSRSAI